MKKEAENLIMWQARSHLKRWKTNKLVFLIFRWVEKDKRRDKDNIAFAKKFIQDALVKMGTIPGDGWKDVIGFIDLFDIDKKNPGVEVFILEVDDEQ